MQGAGWSQPPSSPAAAGRRYILIPPPACHNHNYGVQSLVINEPCLHQPLIELCRISNQEHPVPQLSDL